MPFEPFIEGDREQLIPVTLLNQQAVVLTPVLPTDIERVLSAIPLLSETSLYTRFFTKRPPDHELRKWLESIDQRTHVSWGALHVRRPEIPGIGIMHLIQLPDRPGAAELAITVIDEYQHQGLGTYFLALIYLLCPGMGIHTLVADILALNQPAIQAAIALGATITEENQAGVGLELPVSLDLHDLPPSPELQAFIEKIEWMKEYL